MKIKKALLTNNDCYKQNKKIKLGGGMLHSVGVPQPDPEVFYKNWNKPGVSKCTHGMIGVEEVLQFLEWEQRGWHCGSGSKGSGNDNMFSFEMTEPSTIKYTSGSNWIELEDGSNTKAHVLATYKNAVDVFAARCTQYKLDPLAKGVIMSHSEGHKAGIASNHGDVEHLWNKFGLTMTKFRQDVKNAMVGGTQTVPKVTVTDTSNQKINTLNGTVTIKYDGEDGLNLRATPSYNGKVANVVYKGTYTVVGISADEKWYKLSNGLFITAIPDYVTFKATKEQKKSTAGTGYYVVRKSVNDVASQIGAFKNKDNAINLCKQNSGYIVFDPNGKSIYPEVKKAGVPFQVTVKVKDLRIRKGPGTTYDYWKANNAPKYTGLGTFTITKTAEGPGASLWGLLQYYSDRDSQGWIALDKEFVTRL